VETERRVTWRSHAVAAAGVTAVAFLWWRVGGLRGVDTWTEKTKWCAAPGRRRVNALADAAHLAGATAGRQENSINRSEPY